MNNKLYYAKNALKRFLNNQWTQEKLNSGSFSDLVELYDMLLENDHIYDPESSDKTYSLVIPLFTEALLKINPNNINVVREVENVNDVDLAIERGNLQKEALNSMNFCVTNDVKTNILPNNIDLSDCYFENFTASTIPEDPDDDIEMYNIPKSDDQVIDASIEKLSDNISGQIVDYDMIKVKDLVDYFNTPGVLRFFNYAVVIR